MNEAHRYYASTSDLPPLSSYLSGSQSRQAKQFAAMEWAARASAALLRSTQSRPTPMGATLEQADSMISRRYESLAFNRRQIYEN